MEVAPQELAALLKLAGVGSAPEPDHEPEMMAQPQVSAIAIPSDDEAPTGGCGGGCCRRVRDCAVVYLDSDVGAEAAQCRRIRGVAVPDAGGRVWTVVHPETL